MLAALLFACLTFAVDRAPPADTLRLVAWPGTVYKIDDPGRRGTESWFVDVIVQDDLDRQDIRAASAAIEILARGEVLERRELPTATLERMRRVSYRVMESTPPLALRRASPIDEIFDMRLETWARPAEWAADLMRVTLDLEIPGEGRTTRSLDIPLAVYEQRTDLIFPMRGRGIVTQGQANNHGHSGPANRFAVDVMGVGSDYGPMGGDGEGNAAFAGWGREVIAPAAGTVVYVRNDVSDNEGGGRDPAEIYGALPNPLQAIAGNCVIIDHRNGEYSVLMHMRHGSVGVEVGEAVDQGQRIGEIGNSGDSFGVHLHYQLQDGPGLFSAHSLPVRFDDLGGLKLERGAFFESG